jgi:hypothetical protein
MLGSRDAQQGDLRRDPADQCGLWPLIAAVPGFSLDGFHSNHGCSSISPRPQVLLNQGSSGSKRRRIMSKRKPVLELQGLVVIATVADEINTSP